MASFLTRGLNLKPPADPTVGTFNDTKDSHHHDNIRAISAAGITQGCDTSGTNFCPRKLVTRAQMASFLTRGLNLKPPADPTVGTFNDTKDSHHHDNIRAISAAGITRGCDTSGTNFCPRKIVTRGQMASFISRAINSSE